MPVSDRLFQVDSFTAFLSSSPGKETHKFSNMGPQNGQKSYRLAAFCVAPSSTVQPQFPHQTPAAITADHVAGVQTTTAQRARADLEDLTAGGQKGRERVKNMPGLSI